MKKSRIAALALMAVMASSLAACGSSSSSSGETGAETSTASEAAGEAGTQVSYPLEGNNTLTMWMELNGNVAANYTSMEDTEFAKQWQKDLGVDIEFQHPTQGQTTEQFNLLVADGNYPDLWMYQWTNSTAYPGGPEKAIEDGVILDLTDIIENYCPNLKVYLAEHPEVDKEIKTDSGKYYCFPAIKESDEIGYNMGPMVRGDWLEELGLEVPETIDDWHDMLTAFKEQEGATAPFTSWNTDKTRALSWVWGTPQDQFVLDDGKIVYGPGKDEYKEYLNTMHQWYQEGLLDPDFFNSGEDQTRNKILSGTSGATVAYDGSMLQSATQMGQQENPDFRLVATPWPTLNKGDTPEYAFKASRLMAAGCVAIGGTCEDPALAARVMDYGYSEAGNLLFNYGIEGLTYTMEDGVPTYTNEILNNPDGLSITQAMAKYFMASYQGPFVQDVGYQMQYFQTQDAKDAITTWSKTNEAEHAVPNILPTEEESTEYATIINDLNTYVDEMTSKFIMGSADLDSEWDTYKQTLSDLGLERAEEIQNLAYERYQSR